MCLFDCCQKLSKLFICLILCIFPIILGMDHLSSRGWGGGGGGGVWLSLKKYILIPNDAEKNILILVEGKKKSNFFWTKQKTISPSEIAL